MKEKLIEALKKQKFSTIDEIIKNARLFEPAAKMKVKTELEKLVKTGDVVLSARQKYSLPANAGLIKGKIIGNSNGYAFLRPTNGDDFFIPERSLNGAFHGDEVVCKQINNRQNRFPGKSKQCEVVRILTRGATRVVGIFKNYGAYTAVVPDDARYAGEVLISKENALNAKNNQKVVADITFYPTSNRMAEGKVVEILGEAGDFNVSTLSVIRAYGYDDVFPQEVLDAANKIVTSISAKELEGRTDFRKDNAITIDGEDARDFDDAIFMTKTDEFFTLFVHIADVGHYVPENCVIDKEAFNRGTSVYFPDHVIPMLPEALSNEMCSLKPNEDRLTLSVVMKIDKAGEVVDYKISEGVINSKNRMTYTSVAKILNGEKEECEKQKSFVKMLNEMAELAKILIKRRDKMGQLDFDLPETKIELNTNGTVANISKKPRTMADRLIEQFMLIANETIAKHSSKLKLPFVYRVHGSPTPENLTEFSVFLSSLGKKTALSAENVTPKAMQKLLLEIKDEPYETVVNKMMLRAMQKAVYDPRNLGHFGLACKNYCHFTSPIRRYPDLTIHRILKNYLKNKLSENKISFLKNFVEEASMQSSSTEQKADEVERAVDNLKKAEYMSRKIGEEFDGIISGVLEAGIFVELDNTAEGFIKKDDLPKDRYIFEEKRVRLTGKRNSFALGDKIKIKVGYVELQPVRVNFLLVLEDGVLQKTSN